MCKSFKGDFQYARRMVESFNRHNADQIYLYFVVPQDDIELFESLSAVRVRILSENLFKEYLVADNRVGGVRPGYINQQIVKMAFWETGIAENYFNVDSDTYFIRDFYLSDFIDNDGYPFSVLVDDKELISDGEYYHKYWQGRYKVLKKIAEEIYESSLNVIPKTCHGHTVFNYSVLKNFKDVYLSQKHQSYIDCLSIGYYEFSWYNFWLQKSNLIPVKASEPFIKVFHTKKQHVDALRANFQESDYARGYIGLCVNSNFSRDMGMISYQHPWQYNLINVVARKLWRLPRRIFKSLSSRA